MRTSAPADSMAIVDEFDAFGYSPGDSGVFSDRQLQVAVEREVIEAGRFKMSTKNIQPASIDLRLGEWAHRIRCSFLPGNDTVEQRLKEYGDPHRIDLREGALLESGTPYLIELKERLNLPSHVQAKANPKSSTGRVDVFTRVITDHGHRFDEIKAGYRGPLYLEVVPLSFAVRVREDLTLNQLRLFVGQPEMTDAEIRESHEEDLPNLFRDGEKARLDGDWLSNGLFLGLDLRGDPEGHVGFSANGRAPVGSHPSEQVDPSRYWTSERREEGDRIILHPKKFYLLMSDEAVCIPPTMSAEMTAYDPTSGELRTHYRGLLRPGIRLRPQREVLRITCRARGPRPRRALHDRERSTGVQADLPEDARGPEPPLRHRDRLLLPAAGRDPEQVLQGAWASGPA